MSRARTIPWFFLLGIGLAATGRADVVKPGLVLYLDAAVQIEQGGTNAENNNWTNLAPGARIRMPRIRMLSNYIISRISRAVSRGPVMAHAKIHTLCRSTADRGMSPAPQVWNAPS